MARKAVVFVWLALGGLLPGCANFLPGSSSASEGPTKIYDRAWANPVNDSRSDRILHSTATATASEEPQRILAKMPASPPREGPLQKGPLDVAPPAFGRDREELKKREDGVSGIVTAEQAPMPGEPKNAIFQLPSLPDLGAEPKKEFEAAVLAFHLIFIGKQEEAIKVLSEYPDSTQEFFIRILPLMTQIARKSIDRLSSSETDILNNQLKGLEDFLRTRCGLHVSEMAYCKRIRAFGDFDPLPESHAFLAKTDNRPGDLVQLYVELKNFASTKTREGEYVTKLACSLELKDTHGTKVWSHAFDKSETTIRRSACVNDYHGNYSFYVPALPVGTYQLTMQIVDETIPEHRRVARRSLVFRVTPVANALAPR